MYIWLLPPPGLCPWTPLGDFRLPDPMCPPHLQTLATPLACDSCGYVMMTLLTDRLDNVGKQNPISKIILKVRDQSVVVADFDQVVVRPVTVDLTQTHR